MEDFVPTRSSQVKKIATSDYICVHYTAPKKKVKSTDDLDNKDKLKESTKQTPAELKQQQEKEMKKLRYEIIKFGMSGFEKPKARKAKVELAISLGAIPPKNRRMNYNALKTRQKIEKEKKKEEGHKSKSRFASSQLKPKSKKTRKKDSSILQVYGKVPKNILQNKKTSKSKKRVSET
ncbi:PREDICTED: uncharacterized protein C1orf131 homolog [Cyphomyrmex costatus]|uniref:Uncharacterized protein n=1 Tax=Cyphomyrmex costatus TaxID=456900 RepID=A0A195CI55_9HYME|nr:PREDICTED: uncharacterized protein C1orf131 homolog [Cyphomyrmex costatus]KYN00388.1 hypothetical protein ALC62_08880 [Cyphomyrmex costatus]